MTALAVSLATAPVLEADCVGKSYGSRRILTSASLRARTGAVTALLGRNGIGKSTLLRIACGLLAPDSGIVRMHGETLAATSLASLAGRGLFFLPDRDLLHPRLPLGAQLEAAASLFAPATDPRETAALLRIAECWRQAPRSLSGGERRRAEVAFALVRAPQVLVADEPLRGIDPRDADVLLHAFRAFAANGGALVITGHELPLLLPHVDTITWCAAGTTREFATTEAAMADFAFRRDFLPW